jgi:hypothetical protein
MEMAVIEDDVQRAVGRGAPGIVVPAGKPAGGAATATEAAAPVADHPAADPPPAECILCEAGLGCSDRPAPRPAVGTDLVLAYCDDDVVVFVEPTCAGALVAPRSHAGGLAWVPGGAGPVLAALRRVSLVLQESYATSGTMIEAVADFPGAAGHVCYRVVPTAPDEPLPAGVDPRARADALAAALGRDRG